MNHAQALPKKPEIEFAPDAWERFETLVRSAAKIGHMPHATPPQPKRAAKKQAGRQEEGTETGLALGLQESRERGIHKKCAAAGAGTRQSQNQTHWSVLSGR